ncbi:hypothetical protein PCL_09593 [Purpureocillium lilacinum]|uniref:CHAT domain-containing protein n=1 Tax=Purpureocillium lilacinum TaxID=33203 RepID=A0A2U3DQI0_PURLI|nr:hypothetical protein PCL_09593 [Purpureocillium lilacinum]
MYSRSFSDDPASSESTGDETVIDQFHDHAVLQFNDYQETHDPVTLRTAVQMAHVSAQLTPPLRSHPRRSEILRAYHNMLLDHFRLTVNPKDMVEALLILNQALDFLPENDPYAKEALNFMVKIYTASPMQIWKLEELESDDSHERELTRSRLLYCASELYFKRFTQLQRMEDLTEGCRALTMALEHTPCDNDDQLLWFCRLAFMLQIGYDRSGNLSLLTESIKVCQNALDAASDGGDGEDKAAILDLYANALQSRSKRTASTEDLGMAISLSLDAVGAATESRSKVQNLNNLSNRLEDRFDRMGRVEDLREAIDLNRSALQYDQDPFLLSVTKHNTGIKLVKLHTIDGQDAKLEEGLTLLNGAVSSMPSIGDVPAHWLNSVSFAYRRRYQRHGDSEDLDTAIQYQTKVMENLSRQHRTWPGYSDSMAWLLRERAERTRNRDDLNAALAFVQHAAETVPEDHVHQSPILFSLARLYSLAHTFDFGGRIEITVDGARWTPPWEEQAIDLYFRCLKDQLGDPTSRMAAAAQLMVIFRDRGEYSRGVEVGVQVLGVLHKTNTRSLGPDDQQRVAADFSEFAVETCALSIQAGDGPARALELLELGRGVILGLLIEDRGDISELAAAYPAQAAHLDKLRDEISQPASIELGVESRQDLVFRRDRQVKEFDEVLHEIRKLPGQERFFRGPTAEELQSRAADGSIVVVNIADQRSDAILVSQSDIRLLRLPALEKEQVQNWIKKEPTRWRTRREKGPKNNLYRGFLDWLWKACVEPILTALHLLDEPPAIVLPRIWWIGAGLASFLPFHAAGDHSPGSKANAYTYIISSYTPTVRALSYARERASALRKLAVKKPELLVVLMPTTPDVEGEAVASLTVTDELSAITDAVTPSHSVQPLEHPSCKDVLEQLTHCDMVHFACHGVSETRNPSNSYLILQRPGEQPESPLVADKLTVQDISRAVLGRSRIAYLSACSTAENRAEKLVDEVIHLASGFQVAGFPHVIGALWPSDDQVSVKVAETFYQRISAAHPADDRSIASALREAVMAVRARFPRQPLIWAQYVHIGV